MAELLKAGDAVSSQPLEGFYEKALSKAERVRLRHAHQIQGLEEEIALPRVRLHVLAQDHPENLELLLKGITTLIRAISAKYRLSKQAEEDLFHIVMVALRGNQVVPIFLQEGVEKMRQVDAELFEMAKLFS